jgi:hypothetical protein
MNRNVQAGGYADGQCDPVVWQINNNRLVILVKMLNSVTRSSRVPTSILKIHSILRGKACGQWVCEYVNLLRSGVETDVGVR